MTNNIKNEDSLPGLMAMKKLLDELYSGTGLQGIVDTASDILENSVIINDTFYNIIAKSYKSEEGRKILEHASGNGFISEYIVNAMRKYGLFKKIRHSGEVVMTMQEDISKYWLFKSVKIDNRVVADIAVIADCRPFTEADMSFLDGMEKIVAIEMQKDDFFKINRNMAHSYFIRSLLDGSLTDVDTIEQRARMLDFKMRRYFAVAVADPGSEYVTAIDISYTSSQLQSLIPSGHWTVYEKMAVALFSAESEEVLSTNDRRLLEDYAADNSMLIGISIPFRELSLIPVFYAQALHACQASPAVKDDSGLKYYSDYMIPHIVQLLTKAEDYREYLYPPLIRLSEYDKIHQGDLMETLKTYVMNVCDTGATASQLCIHRNTLLYRLGRIKEITGISFKNGEELFKIILHINIMDRTLRGE